MRRSIMISLAVAVIAASARAGTMDTSYVAAGARWVAHVDATALLQSKIGTLVTNELADEKVVARLDFVRQALGIDPMKDVASVTMYGSDYGDKSGIVIVSGSFATDKIEVFLKAADGYESRQYGSRTIHSWANRDKGRPGYICFPSRGVAVIGAEPGSLQVALDVIDGKKERLSNTSQLHKLLQNNSGFLSLAALKGDANPIDQNPRAAVIKNMESLALGLGEVAGKVKLNALLGVNSPENATQMEQVLNGMAAAAVLLSDSDPELAELSKGLKVSREAQSVRVEFTGDSKSIYDYIKANSPKGNRHRNMGQAPQESAAAPAAAK